MSPPPVLRPVLKWAGGKSRSLGSILEELPESIDTYYEPFVGGAAVFFALSTKKRFRRAVLCDRNPALIDVYKAIKKDVSAVIRVLRDYRYGHDEYYEVRELDPKTLDHAERAARTIFLNKTGYNGLYRENSRGEFNVPFGRYKNPNFCDEIALNAAAQALRNVKLEVGDFEETSAESKKTDAVYFDPPYDPVSKTASFTAYHKVEFGRPEHERLAKVFDRLAGRGVRVVLSNSDTPFTRKLYSKWAVQHLTVSRPINSKGTGRGAVGELLVTSRRRP